MSGDQQLQESQGLKQMQGYPYQEDVNFDRGFNWGFVIGLGVSLVLQALFVVVMLIIL